MQSKHRQIFNMPLIKAMFLCNCLFIINVFIAVYDGCVHTLGVQIWFLTFIYLFKKAAVFSSVYIFMSLRKRK